MAQEHDTDHRWYEHEASAWYLLPPCRRARGRRANERGRVPAGHGLRRYKHPKELPQELAGPERGNVGFKGTLKSPFNPQPLVTLANEVAWVPAY